MANKDKASNSYSKNLINNLDLNELNSESHHWALAHGKYADLNDKLMLGYFFFI